MATVALEAFLPEVLPGVEGVPQTAALSALRSACAEFCRRTLVWTDKLAVPYQTGVADYTLSPPTGAQVTKVLTVVADGYRAALPVSLDALDSSGVEWRVARGLVKYFVQQEQGSVTLVAVPDSDGALTVRVAYVPTPDAEAVGAVLHTAHMEAIRHGALFRLRSMAGTPWFDASLAGNHDAGFRHGISMALIDQTRSFARTPLRVTPVPFV